MKKIILFSFLFIAFITKSLFSLEYNGHYLYSYGNMNATEVKYVLPEFLIKGEGFNGNIQATISPYFVPNNLLIKQKFSYYIEQLKLFPDKKHILISMRDSNGLYNFIIYDISDNKNLKKLGTIKAEDKWKDPVFADFINNTTVVVAWENRFKIVDVSDPENPKELYDSISNTEINEALNADYNELKWIALSGNKKRMVLIHAPKYSTKIDKEPFFVLNIENPSNPKVIYKIEPIKDDSNNPMSNGCAVFNFDGSKLYLFVNKTYKNENPKGLVIFDLSGNTAKKILTMQISTLNNLLEGKKEVKFFNAKYIYTKDLIVLKMNYFFVFLKVYNGNFIILKKIYFNRFELNSNSIIYSQKKDYVFIVSSMKGIFIFDVKDVNNIKMVNQFFTPWDKGDFMDIDDDNEIIFYASNKYLYALSYENFLNYANTFKNLYNVNNITNFKITKDKIYVSELGGFGILFKNFSNEDYPGFYKIESYDSYVYDFYITEDEKYAIILTEDGHITLLDISDPFSPIKKTSIYEKDYKFLKSIKFKNYLFITYQKGAGYNGSSGIMIIDISNLPTLTKIYDTGTDYPLDWYECYNFDMAKEKYFFAIPSLSSSYISYSTKQIDSKYAKYNRIKVFYFKDNKLIFDNNLTQKYTLLNPDNTTLIIKSIKVRDNNTMYIGLIGKNNGKLLVVDISDINNPKLKKQIDLPIYATKLILSSNKNYLLINNKELNVDYWWTHIYSIKDPFNPIKCGRIAVSSNYYPADGIMFFEDSQTLVVADNYGLLFLPLAIPKVNIIDDNNIKLKLTRYLEYFKYRIYVAKSNEDYSEIYYNFFPDYIDLSENENKENPDEYNDNITLNFSSEILNLTAGWNLKALPVNIPELVDEKFNFDEIISIWKWDGKGWLIWTKNKFLKEIMLKYEIPIIDKILPGEGFWVYSTKNLTIDFKILDKDKGYSYDSLLINTGWNLVGAGEKYNPDKLNDITGGKVQSIWKWENNKWKVKAYDPKIKQTINNLGINSFDILNKGEGFWLYKK